MRNLFISNSRNNAFLLIGNDPNTRQESLIRLSGIPKWTERFVVKILGADLTEVFRREYLNLSATQFTLLEFYAYLPAGEYIAEVSLDDWNKQFLVRF